MKSITAKIDIDLWKDLDRISHELNVPMSSVIRWSIDEFINPRAHRRIKFEVEKMADESMTEVEKL
jgi:antitoxin component of RelBE/YafQ-DinJ toxin-antitoxin module